MSSRRTEFPPTVLRKVKKAVEGADQHVDDAIRQLDHEGPDDFGRQDWGNVPPLKTQEALATETDIQLRIALDDARDALAEVSALTSALLDNGAGNSGNQPEEGQAGE